MKVRPRTLRRATAEFASGKSAELERWATEEGDMSYFLTRLKLGDKHRIPLTPEEYVLARRDICNILEALELEEKFDLVLGNYQEFEEDLLRLGVAHAIYKTITWHSLAEDRRILNRRINNLLSACRLYFDQVQHSLSLMYGDLSPERQSIDSARRAEHASSFSYRLFEELRNYTQHRRLPVKTCSVSYKATELPPRTQLACTITPKLMTKAMLEDDKIKKSFLPELKTQPDTIDLKPHIRSYVQSLANVHGTVRSIIDRDCTGWEKTIQNLQTRYTSATPGTSVVGLYIMSVAEETHDIVQEQYTVFLDPLNSMRTLRQSNTVIPEFSKYFVTGQDADRILQNTAMSKHRIQPPQSPQRAPPRD